MANVKSIVFEIEDQIRLGVLSFQAIAVQFKVSYHFVNTVWEQMCANEFQEQSLGTKDIVDIQSAVLYNCITVID